MRLPLFVVWEGHAKADHGSRVGVRSSFPFKECSLVVLIVLHSLILISESSKHGLYTRAWCSKHVCIDLQFSCIECMTFFSIYADFSLYAKHVWSQRMPRSAPFFLVIHSDVPSLISIFIKPGQTWLQYISPRSNVKKYVRY